MTAQWRPKSPLTGWDHEWNKPPHRLSERWSQRVCRQQRKDPQMPKKTRIERWKVSGQEWKHLKFQELFANTISLEERGKCFWACVHSQEGQRWEIKLYQQQRMRRKQKNMCAKGRGRNARRERGDLRISLRFLTRVCMLVRTKRGSHDVLLSSANFWISLSSF